MWSTCDGYDTRLIDHIQCSVLVQQVDQCQCQPARTSGWGVRLQWG
jgi:hypothetical protein